LELRAFGLTFGLTLAWTAWTLALADWWPI